MEFIYFLIAWFVGGFIGAFTVGQVLILIRFGIPTAIRWYRKDWLIAPTPIYRYIFSLFFLSILFILLTWLLIKYFPNYATPYFIGVGITFFFAISKSGESSDNITDFVQVNLPFINHSEIGKLTKELGIDDILLAGKTNETK